MNRSIQIRLLPMALLAVLIGSALVWWLLGCPATGIDDADIFFVYARNFAQGHGFVYNVGGERVEGFTSMLWTLICSGFFRFFRHVEIPLYLFNLLLGTLVVWACLRRVRHPLLFLLLLAASPAWFAWCQVTLMESGIWCLLLTFLVLAVVERRTLAVTLLLPLLVIARPESMLWGAWAILMLGLSIGTVDGWRTGLKRIVAPSVVFMVSLATLVGFRLWYFGYPVPNTYYAKVSPSLMANLWNGMGYLSAYLFSNPVVLLVAATWIWVVVRGVRQWRSGLDPSMLVALCLLSGIGIPVLVGGDHFGAFRFYQPLWPLLCLKAAREWPALMERFHPALCRAVLVVLVLCGWLLFPATARLKHEFRIAREGRATGAALVEMFSDMKKFPTVATITAGGSKYGYPGIVLDLMGLNSTEMGHAPGPRKGYKDHAAFNRDVFYAWKPDILLCGDSAKFDAMVLKGLPYEERFLSIYVKGTLQRNSRAVTAYYRRAFLTGVHDCVFISAEMREDDGSRSRAF